MNTNYNILEINLEDSAPSSAMTVRSGSGATYEEAFLGGSSEEMSNAKGRGRARRQKRRLDRIAKRKEFKLAKNQAKDEVKSARDESRIERRKKRKSKRQSIRDEQMEARQKRRTKRMEMKESRKGRDEEEDEDEDALDQTTDTGKGDDSVDSSTDSGDTGYDDSDDSEDTASDSGSDSKADEYYGDDVDAGQDDAGYDDDSSYDNYPTFEEENNFDGEMSNFVSEVTGKKTISAPVQQICLKIEWNNEMINRLARQKQKMQIDNQDTSRIDSAIDQKFERNANLENQLQQFIGADGSRSGRAKAISRAKEVNRAKRMARAKKLMSVIPPVVMARALKRGLSKQQVKDWWQTKGAKKYSSFSGEAGWDGYPDVIYTEEMPTDFMNYGMPTYDYDTNLGSGGGFDPMSFANGDEIMSFATGEKSADNSWVKSLVVGLLLGGVTIYVIRKYKLLS